MSDFHYFKPTILYKEYMILNEIEKNENITQRELGNLIFTSVSMINTYLESYEKNGYLMREYLSSKTVKYRITKKGVERKKVLNIGFLRSTQRVYRTAKENIDIFLNQMISKGFRSILFYGAGEVAEMFLGVLNDDLSIPISVLAVIDDDVSKQGKSLVNVPIISAFEMDRFAYDGIFISSYTNHKEMHKKLSNLGIPLNKVISLFD